MVEFAAITSRSYSLKELIGKLRTGGLGRSISCLVYSTLQQGYDSCMHGLKWPLKMMSKNMDKRTMRDLVNQAGFEHQQYDCVTEDGYIISLHRVCNKMSFHVVYFQHGVLDNAQTWIVHGRDHSVGYMAHNLGYDVFLGNFRGIYPRKLAQWKTDSNAHYWNYNIDHLAKYDLAAFMKKIIEVKTHELC